MLYEIDDSLFNLQLNILRNLMNEEKNIITTVLQSN